MPTIAELMTRRVQVVGPEESLQRAAQLMDEFNVGALPVCSGTMLLGMVTDRDIALRGAAAGLPPEAGCVSDVMSPAPRCCADGDDAGHVMRRMGQAQLRRMPVLDRRQRLVGIVSLGDLATRLPATGDASDACAALLREISAPAQPGGEPAAPRSTPQEARAMKDRPPQRRQAQADTTPSRAYQREPRLPHEHDESSESQQTTNEDAKAAGAQAARDVRGGLVDTDRGPVLERLNQQSFPPSARPQPRRKAGGGGR